METGEKAEPAFYDAGDFAWTDAFSRRFSEVQSELTATLGSMTPLYAQYTESLDGEQLSNVHWFSKTFVFFTIQNPISLAHVPATAALLAEMPNLVTASLLRLEGGTHLKPHGGYTPDVLRCHLGISVPEPDACTLRVADERRHWEEGKWLIFDDYQEHEVWHTGTKPRVALLVDVVKPGVDASPREVAERFFGGAPGTRYESDLESVASRETWLQWVDQGTFPGMS